MILKHANILVEDNCTIITQQIKDMLKKQEFNTLFFDTSFEAINTIKHQNIDLIIAHNINYIKEIRREFSKESSPILFISHNADENLQEIYEYANDFINISVLKSDLAAKITLTLSRCQKLKNLIELTNKDYLTNTYNKRYFYEAAGKVYKENKNISLCMIDIDNFKTINDTYGHIVGDYAIKELADILKRNTKGKDIVSRFGGDEFCILLQDISPSDSFKIIQKIKDEIKQKTFKLYNFDINFTISVGVATQKLSSLQEMVNSADIDLLKAKGNKPKVKICTNCKLCETEPELV